MTIAEHELIRHETWKEDVEKRKQTLKDHPSESAEKEFEKAQKKYQGLIKKQNQLLRGKNNRIRLNLFFKCVPFKNVTLLIIFYFA